MITILENYWKFRFFSAKWIKMSRQIDKVIERFSECYDADVALNSMGIFDVRDRLLILENPEFVRRTKKLLGQKHESELKNAEKEIKELNGYLENKKDVYGKEVSLEERLKLIKLKQEAVANRNKIKDDIKKETEVETKNVFNIVFPQLTREEFEKFDNVIVREGKSDFNLEDATEEEPNFQEFDKIEDNIAIDIPDYLEAMRDYIKVVYNENGELEVYAR